MDVSSFLLLIIIYAGLNILVCTAFIHDKLRAKVKMGRSSENFLLILAALGPLGALIAMAGFRHKTRKVKFFFIPVFAILHLVLIVWLWPLFS